MAGGAPACSRLLSLGVLPPLAKALAEGLGQVADGFGQVADGFGQTFWSTHDGGGCYKVPIRQQLGPNSVIEFGPSGSFRGFEA